MSVRDDRRSSLDRVPGAADRAGGDGSPERGDLSRRLASLPEGHPSSARAADGSRRQPSVSLRDLEAGADEAPADRVRPLTDAEWSDHVRDVRIRLADAKHAGLATFERYTTDPDHSRWTRDRRHLHAEIVRALYDAASGVPNDHKAIIAGGLAGAGKTTVLEKHAGIDRSQYLTINPDDIKAEMAKRGMVPKVDALSPMEASDLIHEESSYVARQLATRAKADGKNVIWDITMSDRAKTEKRIEELRTAGYEQIDGIFIDIPIDVSVRRADARHHEGEDDYRSGKGLGGRYVPSEIITAQEDERWGCQNRRTFEEVKDQFDHWSRFDNGVDDRDPIRVDASSLDADPEDASI
jgi:predicted ABC-type ATPase